MNSCSQIELVISSRNGDKKAYGELVKLCKGRVFAVCLGILWNIHDAEDAAQQALLKGFTDINTLRENELYGQWICSIARNLCIDIIRNRTKERHAAEEYVKKEKSDFKNYDFLESALASLPEKYRTILLLYYFDGRKSKNIADIMAISRAAVNIRLTRARRELRKILDAERDLYDQRM